MCWVSLFFLSFDFHLLTTSNIRECSPICSREDSHNLLDVTSMDRSYEVGGFKYLLFAFGSFRCTFNLLQWRFQVCQKVIIMAQSRNIRTMVNCSCPSTPCICHTILQSNVLLTNWGSPNSRAPFEEALLSCHDRFLKMTCCNPNPH